MSMYFSRLLEMLLVTKPCVVVLAVCIGVGGCVCPNSSSDWCAGISSLQLMKSDPSSASAADDMTALMIFAIVNTAPLLVGNAVLFDMKKLSGQSCHQQQRMDWGQFSSTEEKPSQHTNH